MRSRMGVLDIVSESDAYSRLPIFGRLAPERIRDIRSGRGRELVH
jgi:hypothetical protein